MSQAGEPETSSTWRTSICLLPRPPAPHIFAGWSVGRFSSVAGGTVICPAHLSTLPGLVQDVVLPAFRCDKSVKSWANELDPE